MTTNRQDLIADLRAECAKSDNPLAVLDDGEFLGKFFAERNVETGYDENGNPRSGEALACEIVEEVYDHFQSLNDEVIVLNLWQRTCQVTSREDYIHRVLGLNAELATDDEIVEAEGDNFMMFYNLKVAYEQMAGLGRFNIEGFLVELMDSETNYSCEASELYETLKDAWQDQVIAKVANRLNPEANHTDIVDYDRWCKHYAVCACCEVDDFDDIEVPAQHAKDGKAFTISFEWPEEI